MGLRAKGCGSTMPRATLRHMRRAWLTDGIVVVVGLGCWGGCIGFVKMDSDRGCSCCDVDDVEKVVFMSFLLCEDV
jgi:hypothetical protein